MSDTLPTTELPTVDLRQREIDWRWRVSRHEASHFVVGFLLDPAGVNRACLMTVGGVAMFTKRMCPTHRAVSTFAGPLGEEMLSSVAPPTLADKDIKSLKVIEDIIEAGAAEQLTRACDAVEDDMTTFAKMCLVGNERFLEDYTVRRVGLEHMAKDIVRRRRREILLGAQILFVTGELRQTDMKLILGN